jgi:hypothetical protein
VTRRCHDTSRSQTRAGGVETRRGVFALMVVAAAVFGGCGTEEPERAPVRDQQQGDRRRQGDQAGAGRDPARGGAAPTEVRAVPGDRLGARYECRGLTFEARATRFGRGAERDSDARARRLRAFLGTQREGFPRHGWHRLAQTARETLFGHPAGGDFEVVTVEVAGNRTQVAGFGICMPYRSVGRFEAAPYAVEAPITPKARTIPVEIDVPTCDTEATPRAIARRLHRVYYEISPRSLTLTAVLRPERPPAGFCAGVVRTTRAIVRLPRAVGARAVRDGAFLSRPVTARASARAK